MRHSDRGVRCLTALVIALSVVPMPGRAAEFMFRARVGDEVLEGKPLAWSDTEMFLLGRDGQLHEFDPREARDGQKTSPRFVGYSMPEMKRALYREFGDELDVTTTQHYIVVHPRGQKDAWAQRFEDLYRWCLAYFRVRGFRPQDPPYPMVAIVYRNQDDYYRAARASGTPLMPGTLGHYDLNTNRVYLYDVTNGDSNADWSENASTIIHEATHQTAFNVGIHSRFTTLPRWLVEGLATMFEARGVWNSQSFDTLKDRVNRERLADFRAFVAKGRPPMTLATLIASDQLFRVHSTAAYAEAWALTLYLCETRPRQFVEYLARTANRPMFHDYPAAERIADFTSVFGHDLKQFEANFLAWMAQIK